MAGRLELHPLASGLISKVHVASSYPQRRCVVRRQQHMRQPSSELENDSIAKGHGGDEGQKGAGVAKAKPVEMQLS